ncbi:MAG: tRNA uridine-5-carboxymethylaminomethyl(34) synthesis GTPase MnmE, partial [Chitinophagaceae bacterium]|nr:tRNA uridine-5-carboxymethylaminomethyl(34) synthesis GTPase MnmE [Chitinophagaceae bacterium]
MNEAIRGWDDTIVALATPPGQGAIAVVRVSGKNAIAAVDRLFPAKNLSAQQGRTLHIGMLHDEQQPIDEVVISLYRSPASYTGEDLVEISCHGSPYIQQQIIRLIQQQGVRLAKPGEFTQRAFLNGKMDLAQAEAVADLIASNTESSRKAALHTMKGGFSQELKELREQLIQFSALIELELDFSQEDVAFADRTQLKQLIDQLQSTTSRLLDSFRLGNAIRQGVSIAIIGKPNAGKSTLLNALLNENRALVSDVAGTTRDTVEEVLNIRGILFRLIDTAGIRFNTEDVIEQMGVEKSLEKMRTAQLVVYLMDVQQLTQEILRESIAILEKERVPYLIVLNKMDILSPQQREALPQGENILQLSAKDKQGLEALKDAIFSRTVEGDLLGEATIVTNERHVEALR